MNSALLLTYEFTELHITDYYKCTEFRREWATAQQVQEKEKETESRRNRENISALEPQQFYVIKLSSHNNNVKAISA